MSKELNKTKTETCLFSFPDEQAQFNGVTVAEVGLQWVEEWRVRKQMPSAKCLWVWNH